MRVLLPMVRLGKAVAAVRQGGSHARCADAAGARHCLGHLQQRAEKLGAQQQQWQVVPQVMQERRQAQQHLQHGRQVAGVAQVRQPAVRVDDAPPRGLGGRAAARGLALGTRARSGLAGA